MNKKLFVAASVLAVSGFLAACGSDENTEGTTDDTGTEAVTDQNDPATSDENTEESTETEEESTDAADETEEAAEETTDEEHVLPEGTLTVSDSQSYQIHLLPAFELTAEEPNKDVVYSSDNDGLFMRIETFTAEEADFASTKESIIQTVQASNDGAELTELPPFTEAEFTKSAIVEIPTEDGKVTGVVFERDGLIVKLTIFDQNEAGLTDEFLRMGKTITAQ